MNLFWYRCTSCGGPTRNINPDHAASCDNCADVKDAFERGKEVIKPA